MTATPTLAMATDTIAEAVASPAAEIAKDVALPAAKFVADRFSRSQAKPLIVFLVAAAVITMVIKRKRADDSTPEPERTNFNGVKEVPPIEQRA